MAHSFGCRHQTSKATLLMYPHTLLHLYGSPFLFTMLMQSFCLTAKNFSSAKASLLRSRCWRRHTMVFFGVGDGCERVMVANWKWKKTKFKKTTILIDHRDPAKYDNRHHIRVNFMIEAIYCRTVFSLKAQANKHEWMEDRQRNASIPSLPYMG